MNSLNKTVHAFDPSSRAYIGPVVLDASDMSPLEPGVFLLPGNCLDAMPPVPAPGQGVFEKGGDWVLLDMPEQRDDVQAARASDDAIPQEQAASSMAGLVQMHMDFAARAMGYDDLNAGISYADEEAVMKFCAEGRALRAWRSLVWQKLFDLQQKIAAGDLHLTAPEDVLPLLPVLEIPKESVPDGASAATTMQAASDKAPKKTRKKGG